MNVSTEIPARLAVGELGSHINKALQSITVINAWNRLGATAPPWSLS
jgi:hypothetical protein